MNLTTWRVVAASVAGSSHVRTNRPCQDAHAWEVLPGGVLLAAVADGAGSAAQGEVGAAVASRAGLGALISGMAAIAVDDPCAGNWAGLLVAALKAARGAVFAEAARRNELVRELATTLILLVVTPRLVAAAQVGDGAVVIAAGEEPPLSLTVPEFGEYINETTFLISSDAIGRAQMAVRFGPVSRAAVLSDGLQMIALGMPGGAPHVPFFRPLFRFVAGTGEPAQSQSRLIDFLNSPRTRERTDDDVTLLLAALVENDLGGSCSVANRQDRS